MKVNTPPKKPTNFNHHNRKYEGFRAVFLKDKSERVLVNKGELEKRTKYLKMGITPLGTTNLLNHFSIHL